MPSWGCRGLVTGGSALVGGLVIGDEKTLAGWVLSGVEEVVVVGDEQALRDEVREQRTVIERQGEVIERLEARLARIERGDRPTPEPVAEPGEGRPGLVVVESVTDRRHLLAKAATTAAGAVVGGAALALGQATPAGAASGTFDGNPAVTATANPTSGQGVRGESLSGIGVNGVSTSGTGVRGISDSGEGVIGESTSGWAVWGNTNDSIGVFGNASGIGEGVRGTSSSGLGVRGASSSGIGVQAISSSSAGIWVETDTGVQLLLVGNPVPPPGLAKAMIAGSIVKDANDDLWFCTVGGNPGTWRRLAGPSTAGALVALPTPVRVYDSRPGLPPTGIGPKTPLAAATPRTVDLKGNNSGVPAGATVVLVNLVATGTTTGIGGYMTIYKNGIAWPGTSNLNWTRAGDVAAVTTLTAVDSLGRCAVYAGSVTDVVVDVLGYYR
jgi:vacuolar-type H+-ATPase subunit F/Vma7